MPQTEVTFSSKTAPARASRYTLASTVPTAEGGRVGVGVDRNGNPYLVHEIGRATEAVALGAVASAVAGGAISPAAIVGAFKETGQLDALKGEVAKIKLRVGARASAPPFACVGERVVHGRTRAHQRCELRHEQWRRASERTARTPHPWLIPLRAGRGERGPHDPLPNPRA